jgi:hypothetical protein
VSTQSWVLGCCQDRDNFSGSPGEPAAVLSFLNRTPHCHSPSSGTLDENPAAGIVQGKGPEAIIQLP